MHSERDARTILGHLEDILEKDTGSLTGSEKLSDIEEWDSVAAMSFIAVIDEELGVTLSNTDLQKVTSTGDLVDLVQKAR